MPTFAYTATEPNIACKTSMALKRTPCSFQKNGGDFFRGLHKGSDYLMLQLPLRPGVTTKMLFLHGYYALKKAVQDEALQQEIEMRMPPKHLIQMKVWVGAQLITEVSASPEWWPEYQMEVLAKSITDSSRFFLSFGMADCVPLDAVVHVLRCSMRGTETLLTMLNLRLPEDITHKIVMLAYGWKVTECPSCIPYPVKTNTKYFMRVVSGRPRPLAWRNGRPAL